MREATTGDQHVTSGYGDAIRIGSRRRGSRVEWTWKTPVLDLFRGAGGIMKVAGAGGEAGYDVRSGLHDTSSRYLLEGNFAIGNH
jgi:hypothetical protein